MHRGPHPATQDSGWLCGLVECPLSFLYLFLPLSLSLSPADSVCCGSLPGRKLSSSHFGPYLGPRRLPIPAAWPGTARVPVGSLGIVCVSHDQGFLLFPPVQIQHCTGLVCVLGLSSAYTLEVRKDSISFVLLLRLWCGYSSSVLCYQQKQLLYFK